MAVVAQALRHARALAERERWPVERREARQRERLTDLVRHAVRHSAYYREALAGYDPAVGAGSLPALSKATMMERFDELVCDQRLRRDALLRHVERLRDDELYLDCLPGDDDERVVGAQGTLRLRPRRLDHDRGAVPVLQRDGRHPTALAPSQAGRHRRRLAGAHEPSRSANARRRPAPDPLVAGHAPRGGARGGAQRLRPGRAQRVPVDGRTAGRGAARRAAATVAEDAVDEQRAAHAGGRRAHRGGLRRPALRPLRDHRRAVGRRVRAPRGAAPVRGGRHRGERRRRRARGA